jgi:hypothetical protein
MAMYGAPIGGSWGGLFSDLVRVPYADAMLVPLPAGLDPVAMASASDNWSLAWRLVAPHYLLDRPRNGVPGLRARHDWSPLLTMIWGVVSPVPEALADR